MILQLQEMFDCRVTAVHPVEEIDESVESELLLAHVAGQGIFEGLEDEPVTVCETSDGWLIAGERNAVLMAPDGSVQMEELPEEDDEADEDEEDDEEEVDEASWEWDAGTFFTTEKMRSVMIALGEEIIEKVRNSFPGDATYDAVKDKLPTMLTGKYAALRKYIRTTSPVGTPVAESVEEEGEVDELPEGFDFDALRDELGAALAESGVYAEVADFVTAFDRALGEGNPDKASVAARAIIETLPNEVVEGRMHMTHLQRHGLWDASRGKGGKHYPGKSHGTSNSPHSVHEDETVFAVRCFIDEERKPTNELTIEEARTFRVAAEHLIAHLCNCIDEEVDEAGKMYGSGNTSGATTEKFGKKAGPQPKKPKDVGAAWAAHEGAVTLEVDAAEIKEFLERAKKCGAPANAEVVKEGNVFKITLPESVAEKVQVLTG